MVEQNIFAEILSQFIAAYQLPLRTDPSRIGVHSWTLTSDETLRDDLFLACASLHSPALRFSFASLTDVTPETALAPIWLRSDECMASLPAQEPLLPGGPPAVRPALERHDLAALPRVSLTD